MLNNLAKLQVSIEMSKQAYVYPNVLLPWHSDTRCKYFANGGLLKGVGELTLGGGEGLYY